MYNAGIVMTPGARTYFMIVTKLSTYVVHKKHLLIKTVYSVRCLVICKTAIRI